MEGEELLGRVITYVFSPLYQLLAAVTIVYFLYGVVKFIWYMRNPDDGSSTERNNGKQHMFWGLVGIFIIFSVGGIIKLFNSLLGGMFVF